MSVVEAVGGPLDGLLTTTPRGPWAWLSRSARHPIAAVQYRAQRDRRWLYRLVDGAWVYAGDTHRVCGNCGALVRNPEAGQERAPCGLCAGVAENFSLIP